MSGSCKRTSCGKCSELRMRTLCCSKPIRLAYEVRHLLSLDSISLILMVKVVVQVLIKTRYVLVIVVGKN